MSAWSPTSCRTPRTCGGPGSCWQRCTARSATTPAASTPRTWCSRSTRRTARGCGCSAPSGRGPCSGVARRSLRPRRPTPGAAPPTGRSRRPPRSVVRRFFAWYAHGEWDSTALGADEGALHLLRPMLTVDPRMVGARASRGADPGGAGGYANGEHLEEAAELVRLAAGRAPHDLARLGPVTAARPDPRPDARHRGRRPRADAATADPGAVVARQRPGIPFEYAVMVVRGRMIPVARQLPAAGARRSAR